MLTLPPPLKRHLLGARPTHCGTKALGSHFAGLPQEVLLPLLQGAGYLTEEGRPTELAVTEEVVAACERKLLWSLAKVEEVLRSGGLSPERVAQQQEVGVPAGDPQWANLGTLATYFSVSAPTVGKWLDDLGLREGEEHTPTKEAVEGGLASLREMKLEGKKTRQITHWNLHVVKALLVEAGHELNFDYEGSLKGRGRNGDVEVQENALERRAREVAQEFTTLFRDPQTRPQVVRLVNTTPRPLLKGAEDLLRKPGLLTLGHYRRYL